MFQHCGMHKLALWQALHDQEDDILTKPDMFFKENIYVMVWSCYFVYVIKHKCVWIILRISDCNIVRDNWKVSRQDLLSWNSFILEFIRHVLCTVHMLLSLSQFFIVTNIELCILKFICLYLPRHSLKVCTDGSFVGTLHKMKSCLRLAGYMSSW